MAISKSAFIESYLKTIGVVGNTMAGNLREQATEIYDPMLMSHLCRWEWPFMETSDVEIAWVSNLKYYNLDLLAPSVEFIKTVRVSTESQTLISDITPVPFAFYELLLREAQAASTNPQFVAKKDNKLYPYPSPTTNAKLTISGLLLNDTSGVYLPSIPNRHTEALYQYMNYKLGRIPTLEPYLAEVANLGGIEAVDFWGKKYGAE